jgi:transcriptional regulator with XRE-family HTH domain
VARSEVLPSIAGLQLQTKLKDARDRAKLTRKQAADKSNLHLTKLLRIENGATKVSTNDLIALANAYALSRGATDELIELARISWQPTIADDFRSVLTPEFRKWLEFELSAKYLRQYETKYIPGILQNNGYAYSVISIYSEGEAEDVIQRRVQARSKRADLLLGPDGPSMWFIIDEAALRRGIGNSMDNRDFSIMLRVLDNLKKLNTVGRRDRGEPIEDDLNPNVSIQIVPFEIGVYSALPGPFEILEFDDPRQELIVYEETRRGDFVIKGPGEYVTPFLERFFATEEIALPAKETSDFLDRIGQMMLNGTNGIPFQKKESTSVSSAGDEAEG